MKDFEILKKNVEEYAKILEFPCEARARLLLLLDSFAEKEDVYEGFCRLLESYDECEKLDYQALTEEMKTLSESVGADRREGWLLLYVSMLPRLRRYFEEKGIPDKLFLDVIPDIRYKLTECTLIEGVYGLMDGSAVGWYAHLFNCRLFTFGRLQFVFQAAGYEYTLDGVKIEKDTPLLNIHIPRTGGKMDREGVLEAYRLAAEYYADAFGDRPIIMACTSWMLFPRHAEFLPAESNMMQFYHDFQIVDSGNYENYSAIWRLFDCHYTGDVDALPANTSLRRAYIEMIRRGEKTGWGRGIFIYKK